MTDEENATWEDWVAWAKNDKGTTARSIHYKVILAADAELAALRAAKEEAEGSLCRAIEVIGFYGDPKTYTAIGIFADPPCGEFAEDYSYIDDDDRPRPGKRAREFLFGMEAEFDRRAALPVK